jgi:hypothetical protein
MRNNYKYMLHELFRWLLKYTCIWIIVLHVKSVCLLHLNLWPSVHGQMSSFNLQNNFISLIRFAIKINKHYTYRFINPFYFPLKCLLHVKLYSTLCVWIFFFFSEKNIISNGSIRFQKTLPGFIEMRYSHETWDIWTFNNLLSVMVGNRSKSDGF